MLVNHSTGCAKWHDVHCSLERGCTGYTECPPSETSGDNTAPFDWGVKKEAYSADGAPCPELTPPPL
ncbi:hypothetical protein Rcae01_05599 [Novipirellula caenicola]|uniref:Uncharacterized protein n=1 Tax=Novipirellula caenicola TaxID=1536901 RepID=A0ABP9W0T8_9BACT